MSVKFVIGRAGSGKTFRCFSNIVDALRTDPLGPPIFWILPRQATFMAERQLTCASGLDGFCRARVVGFHQLAQEISADCGASSVPEVTAHGRQMILGHLLRRHSADLVYFKSVERQAGLAAELDATFDELERSGKTAADLATLLDDLSHSGPLDVEGESLRAKLGDLRLLYDAYVAYLGQDRLDQHRRLQQVLELVKSCSFISSATFYVDGFLEFTDHERRMLGAIARAGAKMEITLLMDPASPLLADPHLMPDEMGLFHRTETTYRRLWWTFAEEHVAVDDPVPLRESRRFASPTLSRLEREMFTPRKRRAWGSEPEPAAQEDRAIACIEAPDRVAEVDAVARRARLLLAQGCRLREIAVIVRSLESYHALIAASFDEHDIPYFVDRRRTAAHHPLLQLLRGALQAARNEWNHDAVLSLMKTGLAGLSLDEADELENYVLLHRVRGISWESSQPWEWRRDLLRRDGEDQDAPDPLHIDALRRRIAGGLSPLVHLLRDGAARPVREIASEIFAMFERFGVRRTLVQWMDAADSARPQSPGSAGLLLEEHEEHEQVWAKLCELFDQMVDLLGDEQVTPTDFSDIVESGLDRFDLGITPPTADQVLVGQADRTRCPPVKAVFVLGLNEAEFPAAPHEATVLSDRERRELRRRRLDLDPDGQRRLLDEPLLGYVTFTQPSQHLILTRPLGDDAGQPAGPSIFWQRIMEMFPSIRPTTIPRPHAGDVEPIATPRQLIAGLMGWIRGGAGADAGATQELTGAASSPAPSPLYSGERAGVRGETAESSGSSTLCDTQRPSDKAVSYSPPLTPTLSPEYRGEGAGGGASRGHSGAEAGEDASPEYGALVAGEDADANAHATSSSAWPALYHWLITDGSANPSVARLRNLAWPALSYTNNAALSPHASSLFATTASVSVGQLETMAACPFKHFVQYGLRLSAREEPDVTGGDLGQVYHRLLDRLVSQAIASTVRGLDPFAISPEAIHAAATQVAKSLRGELLLSTARNRYLLQRVERTLGEVIASQQAMMNRGNYRPTRAAAYFGEQGVMPAVRVRTPGGKQVLVEGKIDRVDTQASTGDAIAIDYRLGSNPLSLPQAYHGLALQLLTYLLALQVGGEELLGHELTPTGAFFLSLSRNFNDVDHPDDAADPSDETFLLRVKPRGVFDIRALPDLDSAGEQGASPVVAAYIKKDGRPGNHSRMDTTSPAEFRGLLDLAERRIGQLADQIFSGNISITPYRLARQSPCSRCEFRGLCRFETTVNRYRHLTPLNREQVLESVRGKEAANGD